MPGHIAPEEGISDAEVVQAFADYQRQLAAGILGSLKIQSETLFENGGRLVKDCEAAVDRAVKRGLVKWHEINAADRGPTEQGCALLAGSKKVG